MAHIEIPREAMLCLDSQSNKHTKKEMRIMSSSNNSNQPVVPSAREALNKFKMEAAQEVDV